MIDHIKSKGFHLLHLNVRSLWPKIDVIRILLYNNNMAAVLTLSETWLNKDIPSEMVCINNYNLFRHDRDWGDTPDIIKKGGGICTYIRADYNVLQYAFQNLNESSQNGEMQWLLVKNKHCKNIIIVNCYRPPAGNVSAFIKTLETKLLGIDRGKYDVFVTGDMNIDLINNNCNNSKLLKSSMEELGFSQYIKKPTRYGQNKNTLLDVLFSNSLFIANSGVCDVNISDHRMVFCTRKKVHTRKCSIEFKGRSYRNFNENKFTTDFQNLNWDDFEAEESPDKLWDIYKENIKKVFDPKCPIKNFKIARDRDPWVSDELINEIKQKDYLLKKGQENRERY